MNRAEIMIRAPASFAIKLRRNIALEGDLALASRELEAYLGSWPLPVPDMRELAGDLPDLAMLSGWGALEADCRIGAVQGYRGEGLLARLPEMVRRLAFAGRIYAVAADGPAVREALMAWQRELGPVLSWQPAGARLVIQALPHSFLLELSDIAVRRAASPAEVSALLRDLPAALLGPDTAAKFPEAALAAQQTTSHVFHDLHYYKAKFFPRMVRATLGGAAQRLGPGPHRVLDPFAGSGTTLVEASLLGFPSQGYDLDPLSVMISRAKLTALKADWRELVDFAAGAAESLRRGGLAADEAIGFPGWLTKNRRFTADMASRLSEEIRQVRPVLAACEPRWRDLCCVLISDAMSRRIRMRLLGTGVGRFSLTFSHATLPALLDRSLARLPRVAAAASTMRDMLHLDPAPAEAAQGDARALAPRNGPFDILLTSPPYLPASSGRETYAKARVLSFLGLGLLEGEGIDALVDDAVGSMDGGIQDPDSLAAGERAVVQWLAADDLRAIKAEPTARYFADMKAAFRQMRRVLAPGGLAVVVSGRQSTFYEFATRRPLYVVESAQLLADSAEAAGFEVEDLVHVALAKTNRNARPRSLDDYYETLIVLRKRVDGSSDPNDRTSTAVRLEIAGI
jgi:DNA modification methylase